MELMKNVEVHIHNHPGSPAFSAEDIEFYIRLNAKKGIVVSDDYIYELFPKTEWPITGAGPITHDWHNYDKLLYEKYFKIYKERIAAGMAEPQAGKLTWIEQTNEIMESLAETYKLNYTRKKTYGGK